VTESRGLSEFRQRHRNSRGMGIVRILTGAKTASKLIGSYYGSVPEFNVSHPQPTLKGEDESGDRIAGPFCIRSTSPKFRANGNCSASDVLSRPGSFPAANSVNVTRIQNGARLDGRGRVQGRNRGASPNSVNVTEIQIQRDLNSYEKTIFPPSRMCRCSGISRAEPLASSY
jgi:hypothetical protein